MTKLNDSLLYDSTTNNRQYARAEMKAEKREAERVNGID